VKREGNGGKLWLGETSECSRVRWFNTLEVEGWLKIGIALVESELHTSGHLA